MRIEGSIKKTGHAAGAFEVEIPILGILLHGDMQSDALCLAKDALGQLLSEHTDGLVTTSDLTLHCANDSPYFEIETSRTKAIVTLLLKRLRLSKDMSQAEVAKILGSSSRNSVGQYEEGKSEPGFSKFQEILSALNLDLKISIVDRRDATLEKSIEH